MIFKRSKISGSTPATPKIGSIELPGEDDLKAKSPLKRFMSTERRLSISSTLKSSSSSSSTKSRDVEPVVQAPSRTRVDSLLVVGKSSKTRSRSDSVVSATMPIWSGSSTAKAKADVDTREDPKASNQGRPSILKKKTEDSFVDSIESGSSKGKLYAPTPICVFSQTTLLNGHGKPRVTEVPRASSSHSSAKSDPFPHKSAYKVPAKGSSDDDLHGVPWPSSAPPSRATTPLTKPEGVRISRVPMKVADGPSPKRREFRGSDAAYRDGLVLLHWLMVDFESSSHRMRGSRLRFDAKYPIENNSRNLSVRKGSDHWHSLPHREREAPVAGDAVLKRMVIRCDALPDWPDWHVVVERASGIRCIDVFQRIYEEYNRVLTPAEWASIPRPDRDACLKAFKHRCKHGPGLESYERGEGPRRVDLLKDATFFRGLTWSPGKGANWAMHFYPPLAADLNEK